MSAVTDSGSSGPPRRAAGAVVRSEVPSQSGVTSRNPPEDVPISRSFSVRPSPQKSYSAQSTAAFTDRASKSFGPCQLLRMLFWQAATQ
jgi:hypothetical protein